ncbi:unnamed protein product [Gulo gulo]|uniref:Uncharacterized protein n=1 Tax=Gulo gulo TaxID=48420 RepID=A0A9X9PXA1_GULGU|nr:unnamed protein product [Gulo gulo]
MRKNAHLQDTPLASGSCVQNQPQGPASPGLLRVIQSRLWSRMTLHPHPRDAVQKT